MVNPKKNSIQVIKKKQKTKKTIIDNLDIRSDQKRVFCSFNSSLKSG